MGIVLHLHQVPLGFQVSNDLLSCLIPVKALVFAAQLVDLALIVQHPDDLQVVPQADLKVVGVVGGGHFDTAGTKFHFRIGISDHGNGLIQQGQDHVLSDNRAVALILGVNADAGVTQHGFRTGGGDDDLTGAVFQGIADVPQMAGLIHIFHFCVAKGGHTVGAPVDDPAALVDQALFVQGDKHLSHGLGAALVHGEPGTVPVAAGTQLLLLLYDPVAEAVFPVPNPLQEFFTSDIFFRDSLFSHCLYDLRLGRNRRMVGSRKPKCFITLHSLKTNENVLQRIVKGMSHVKLSRDVWWRNYDRIRFLILIYFRMKILLADPFGIKTVFNVFWIIIFFQFYSHDYLR